jgi:hypothetical protein
MSLPRSRRGRCVLFAGLSVLPLLWLAQAWLGPRPGPRFRDVRELKAWAEGRGLHCRSDWEDGRVTSGLAISTRPLTWDQVGRLCLAAPGRGAGWEGVIWAINWPSGPGPARQLPWDGESRVWGQVLVTGDRGLLDRLEREGG